MRRALFWIGGIALAAALVRAARRRGAPQAPLEPAPDPADELRETLATAREAGDPRPAPASPSLQERRARVHEQAQEAIDLMREQDEEP